ncbi:YybH family protein [Sphingobium sp. Z007]|uniref:YybH family protein n=3 Tax=Sphingobium sp. Z007 TaxID=627495 RepID=UPI001595437F|nr:nuclear transport factor 2 family protein [Sphingobium sp. Z007]
MTMRLRIILGVLCLTPTFPAQATARDPSSSLADARPASRAQTAVAGQIDRYIASINSGDVEAAKMLWDDSSDITFINTTGLHKGWPAINGAVHSFFRDKFTRRDLRLVAKPTIQIFGNAAVAQFIWDFDGTMTSGKELHTRGGRESQLYVRTGQHGWRLVHAHYSLQPPPITP